MYGERNTVRKSLRPRESVKMVTLNAVLTVNISVILYRFDGRNRRRSASGHPVGARAGPDLSSGATNVK